MKKFLWLLYGILNYLLFWVTLLALIVFIGNLGFPWGIDAAPRMATGPALLIDLLLVAQFGLQHSLMARKWYKDRVSRIIPRPLIRSTYTGIASLSVLLLIYFWQPLGGRVWVVEQEAWAVFLFSLFFLGWTLSLSASFMINHFDLLGLRQIYLYVCNRPYTALDFVKPSFYKYIRHPLYSGYLIAFWATPVMTVSHLVFSLTLSIYVFIGIGFEEKDLIADFGERYLRYKKRTPAILPVPKLWMFRRRN